MVWKGQNHPHISLNTCWSLHPHKPTTWWLRHNTNIHLKCAIFLHCAEKEELGNTIFGQRDLQIQRRRKINVLGSSQGKTCKKAKWVLGWAGENARAGCRFGQQGLREEADLSLTGSLFHFMGTCWIAATWLHYNQPYRKETKKELLLKRFIVKQYNPFAMANIASEVIINHQAGEADSWLAVNLSCHGGINGSFLSHWLWVAVPFIRESL